MPNLKGTKTEQNLMKAFAGESEARNKYTFYANKAREEGYEQIGNIFDETANNEKEHAEIWFKQLHDGIHSTEENLKDAAMGEHYEWTEMYPQMAKEAIEEGFNKIAYLFNAVAAIEETHDERYLKLLNNLQTDTVFKKPENVMWQCLNCGHIHIGTEAPEVCPVCKYPQGFFQIYPENY